MQFRAITPPNEPEPLVERLGVSVEEAAKMLGISPRKVHELTRSGELPCKRIGRRVLYSVEVLRQFINGE